MRNVILIGMPGSGKSTFGREAAARLARPFIDLDAFIEEREGRSIPSLFEESEDCFRKAETAAAKALFKRDGLIIASGGGFVKREENRRLLRKGGVSIFIDRAPEAIVSDVAIAGRPLLSEGAERVYALYKERIGLYRKAADARISNEGREEEVLQALVRLIQSLS